MNVAKVLSWHVLAGVVLLGYALGDQSSLPAQAGEPKLPPGLAVVAEPVVDKNCQFLRLYLENTTEKAVEVVDFYCPAFTVDTWFMFKVDGKWLDVIVPGVHSFGDEKRMVPAKSKTYIGKAILHEFQPVDHGGYTPVLNLKAGKHTLEIASKKGIKPAKLEVIVPEKPMSPNPVPEKEPDQKYETLHGGQAPLRHTALWFDAEIGGKAERTRLLRIAANQPKKYNSP